MAHRRSWRYESAVLEQLARHRGYYDGDTREESDGRRWAIRMYPFRAIALEELKKKNRLPREEIQVEERLPLPRR